MMAAVLLRRRPDARASRTLVPSSQSLLLFVHFFVPSTARPSRNCSFHRTRSAPCTPSARSTVCGSRGPLVASPFLQSGAVKIGAAQPQKRRRHCTPSRACRFALRDCTFPIPRAVTSVAAGVLRAAPRAARATAAPARSFIGHVDAAARFPPALGVSRPLRRARKGMRSCARATVAPRRHARPVARASRACTFPPPNLVHARMSPVAAPKARLKLSWPAAAWLRTFPRARAACRGGSGCESLLSGPRSLAEP